MKTMIVKYHEDKKLTGLDPSLIGMVDSNIYLASEPVAPSRKTSPSNSKNVIIGFFLGGVIGVLSGLIKEFWKKN
jgi:capsular polysaccharide biosynthesis protein